MQIARMCPKSPVLRPCKCTNLGAFLECAVNLLAHGFFFDGTWHHPKTMLVPAISPKFACAFSGLLPSWRDDTDAMRDVDRRPANPFLLKQAKREVGNSLACGKTVG
jgi:hypothetical protein